MKFRAAPRVPLFVLVNGATSTPLLRALRAREPGIGVVIIGSGRGEFSPDLLVRTAPEEERKAYDAFENGVAIATLIADSPEKVRMDEASLTKDRGTGPLENGSGAVTPTRAAPVVDVALLRAVHLHRSLLALKKI